MEEGAAVVLVIAVFIASFALAYHLGKYNMRMEITTYGCESVMKAYEVKP